MSSSNSFPQGTGKLLQMVQQGATYPDISKYLDSLSPSDRVEEVRQLKGKWVGALYRAVSDAPSIGADEFLPSDTEDGETVIFEGRNSLPAFSLFQKRFCRRDGKIVGYNHGSMSMLTGPGYFMTVDADGSHPGELLFDYTQEPTFYPPGWPEYQPNGRGFSKLVFEHMKDYCRRVAEGVIVGNAFKKGADQGQFFTLSLPRPFRLNPSPCRRRRLSSRSKVEALGCRAAEKSAHVRPLSSRLNFPFRDNRGKRRP